MRPTWARFWEEYPDYINFPDSAAVKKMIGGSVNDTWITNTCAVRMSRGLNYSGVPVPGNFAGMETTKGGDKLRYAFRVAEMRTWLPTVLGAADIDTRKKSGAAFDKASFGTMKGIIGFDIHFSDATGHLDFWDGSVFSSEYNANDYWAKATRITLWALP